jgi:hypothetical protein
MKKFRSRLTYSNVMVTVLAFVVLGGTAYAATELGKNSVGTKQLKRGAVTQAKIAKAAQAALKGQAGPRGNTGAVGPRGERGAKGENGANGSDAASILMAKVSGIPQSALISYGSPSGTSASTPQVADVYMQSPFNTPIVTDDLSVRTSVPIGVNGCGQAGACEEVVTLFVDGAELLSCHVPFNGTTCSSGSASATIPAGSEVAFSASQLYGSSGSFDMQVSLHTSPG